jgi:hypothetical protein
MISRIRVPNESRFSRALSWIYLRQFEFVEQRLITGIIANAIESGVDVDRDDFEAAVSERLGQKFKTLLAITQVEVDESRFEGRNITRLC